MSVINVSRERPNYVVKNGSHNKRKIIIQNVAYKKCGEVPQQDGIYLTKQICRIMNIQCILLFKTNWFLESN